MDSSILNDMYSLEKSGYFLCIYTARGAVYSADKGMIFALMGLGLDFLCKDNICLWNK
jgi:hypothetical protein